MDEIKLAIQSQEVPSPQCVRIAGVDCPVERMVLAAEFCRALPEYEVKVNPAYPQLYLFPRQKIEDADNLPVAPQNFTTHEYAHPQSSTSKYDLPLFALVVAAMFGMLLPLPPLLLNASALLIIITVWLRFWPKNMAWHLRGLLLGWPTPQLLLWVAAVLPMLSLPMHFIADTPATNLLVGAVTVFMGHLYRIGLAAFALHYFYVGDPRGSGNAFGLTSQFFTQAMLWLSPVLALVAFFAHLLSPTARLLADIVNRFTFLPFAGDAGLLLDSALQSASAMLLLPPAAAMLLVVHTLYLAVLLAARQRGIVCESLQSLATLDQVSILAMRRTGILTQATPKVKELAVFSHMPEKEAVGLAAGLEQISEHPCAEAFRAYARRKWIEAAIVDEIVEAHGLGVSGMWEGRQVYLGGEHYMASLGIKLDTLKHTLYRLSRTGNTPLILADAEAPLAVFALEDPLQTTSVKLNKALQTLGVTPVLLSHQNRELAKTVAEQCALQKAFAEVTPDDLAAALRLYQKERVGKTALLCLSEQHKKLRDSVDVLIVGKAKGEGSIVIDSEVEAPHGLADVHALFVLLRKMRKVLYVLLSGMAVVYMLFVVLALLGIIPTIFAPTLPAVTLYSLHVAAQYVLSGNEVAPESGETI